MRLDDAERAIWNRLDRLCDLLFGLLQPGGDRSRERWLVRYLVLVGVLSLIVVLRRPDAIRNAQFWGDENEFFLDQLTMGFWAALRHLHAGFPYLAQRVIAALASLVPIARAPLVYNVGAIALTGLAAGTFSLPGFRHLVQSDALRVLVCLATVCIPAGQELLATVTNVGFFVGPWLVFLSVMAAPGTVGGMTAWCVAGIVGILSTPGAVVAAPLWVPRLVHGMRRRRWADVVFASTQIAAMVAMVAAAGSLGAGIQSRPGEETTLAWQPSHLWSAFGEFGWVVSACVDAALLPARAFARLEPFGAMAVGGLALAAAAGLALAFRDLSSRGRVTVGLAIYMLAASVYLTLAGRHGLVLLLRGEMPVPGLTVTTLQIFGPRYRALPNVAILLALTAVLDGARHAHTRLVTAAIACTGIVLAWAPEFRIGAFPDLHWPMWAARLEQKLATGSDQRLVIPSHPPTFEMIFPPDPWASKPRVGGERGSPPAD